MVALGGRLERRGMSAADFAQRYFAGNADGVWLNFGRVAGSDDLVIGFPHELLGSPDCAMRLAWQVRCAGYALFDIAA